MLKFTRFNCEGFSYLFTYTFDVGVYVVQGDYSHGLVNALYIKYKDSQGLITFDGNEVDNFKEFSKNEVSVITEVDNFIPYLKFSENLKLINKIKSNTNRKYKYVEVFESLNLDLKMYDKHINNVSYIDEIMYAIAKSILTNDKIIFVILGNYAEENTQIIHTISQINVKIDKIFIIIDNNRHIKCDDVTYLKYFQGYISPRIMEAK